MAKCLLCIVWMLTLLSASRYVSPYVVSRAHRHMRVLRTATEGASVSIVLTTKVILVFRFVASLSKYAFRIKNPSLFIDCNIENSCILEKWRTVWTSSFKTYGI